MAETLPNVISRREYLQKYLSVDKKKKKKKKTRPILALKQPRSQIIDDDLNLNNLPPPADDSEPEYGEEAPVVVEVVDERPKQVLTEEVYRKSNKWKILQNLEDKTDSQFVSSSHTKNDIIGNSSLKNRKRHDSVSEDETIKLFSDNSKPDDEFYLQSGCLEEKKFPSDDLPKNCFSSDKVTHGCASDSDLSPIREKRRNSDLHPSPLRKRRISSDSDPSPLRKTRTKSDSDLCPLRERQNPISSKLRCKKRSLRHHEDSKSRRPHAEKYLSSEEKKEMMKSKMKSNDQTVAKRDKEVTGLQSATVFKKEMEAAQLEREKSIRLNNDETIAVPTIFRDKRTGQKRNFEMEARKKREEKHIERDREEKYRQWGKGLKQIETTRQQIDEMQHEMSKPLARYKDDADLDSFLRSQEREGDPALLFMKKKSTTEENERQQYRGPPPPPNRFGILPGFRWDGVDRSNGFEKERFLRLSNQKAMLEENYKWSTEDM